MNEFQNAWTDSDGAIAYWVSGSPVKGRRVMPPGGTTITPVRDGWVTLQAARTAADEAALVQQLPEDAIRSHDFGRALAPAILVNEATGLPCWFPFDATAPEGRRQFGSGTTPEPPKRTADGFGYEVALRDISGTGSVEYQREAQRDVSITTRPGEGERYSLEIASSERAVVRAVVCNSRLWPVAPTHVPLVSDRPTLRIDGVGPEGKWLAVALLDPGTSAVVAAGVFDLAAPLAISSHTSAEEASLFVDADALGLSASILTIGVADWRSGPIAARRFGALNAVGALLARRLNLESPYEVGAFWVPPRPDEPAVVAAAIQGLAAPLGSNRPVRVRLLTGFERDAYPGGRRHYLAEVSAAFRDTALRLEDAREGAGFETHRIAVGSAYVCANTPASWPISFGVCADMRDTDLQLGLCMRSSSQPPTLIATVCEPVGVRALLVALDRILSPTGDRRRRQGVGSAQMLRELRNPRQPSSPSSLKAADAVAHRFYEFIAELIARFTVGSILPGPGLVVTLEKDGYRSERRPLGMSITAGHFWLRVTTDGWGFGVLYPDSRRQAFVPDGLAVGFSERLRRRILALAGERGMDLDPDRLLVDPISQGEPSALRGARTELVPRTALGSSRTLTVAGIDLFHGQSRVDRWDPFGTAAGGGLLDTRLDWTPSPDSALLALGVSPSFGVPATGGSPLGELIGGSIDELISLETLGF